jgi:endonuclease/exonuclease/phosphatase (EEP) superfamily protein YafD
MAVIQGFVVLALTYALFVFAYLLPPAWRSSSRMHVTLAWFAFLIRVFQFHIGMLIAVVVVWSARRRQWRLVVAGLPILLFTFVPVARSYLPRSTPLTGSEGFTVMSCNLLMINRQTASVIHGLVANDPDVILYQEYTDHWHTAIQQELGAQYPYEVCFPREDSFGAAIYSRLPFVGKPTKFLRIGTFGEPQMCAVVDAGGCEIAIYNLHLVPPWGGLAYIQEHGEQFADLLDLLAAEQRPAIIGGDFNFTETTPHAAAVTARGFHDAQDEAGHGRGATWSEHGIYRWLPGLRLDHIYLSADLVCTHFEVGADGGSDHRPIIARIAIRK